MQLVKKITCRDVMGNMKEIIRESGKKNGEKVGLFTIIGQVIGFTTGESQYGPWVKLKGRFRATNVLTGEVFTSSVAMLPDEATDPILAALTLDDVSSVDCGFDIAAKIDDTTAVGYQYVVTPLMKPAEDDPLERLNRQIQTGQIEHKPDAEEKAAGGKGKATATK